MIAAYRGLEKEIEILYVSLSSAILIWETLDAVDGALYQSVLTAEEQGDDAFRLN